MANANFTAQCFRVTGRVQKVWFRKHTQDQANLLNIRGFVQNNLDGSVSGEIVGTAENVKKMQHWLTEVGSPQSKIENSNFETLEIQDPTQLYETLPKDFEFRRPHLKK